MTSVIDLAILRGQLNATASTTDIDDVVPPRLAASPSYPSASDLHTLHLMDGVAAARKRYYISEQERIAQECYEEQALEQERLDDMDAAACDASADNTTQPPSLPPTTAKMSPLSGPPTIPLKKKANSVAFAERRLLSIRRKTDKKQALAKATCKTKTHP
jgi:hypothetical protein